MNCEQLIKSWNNSKTEKKCSCCVIKAPMTISLLPNTINEIKIPFKGKTPCTVLQVKQHMTDKPWKIIGEYLYFNQSSSSITIPIMSSQKTVLLKNEAICHVQLMAPFGPLQTVTSKFLLYIRKSNK
jgi:hypothetical protein